MSNQDRKLAKAQKRKEHIPIIKAFCEDNGLTYKFIHNFEWHIRIEGVLDIYTTTMKWHWLPTEERGEINDYDDIGKIFMEHME